MVSYKRFLSLQDWLRFSVAFWHTFRGTGSDPFGAPTKFWPWEDGTNSLDMAKRRSKIDLLNQFSVIGIENVQVEVI